jgi:hypothetical protein
MESHFLGLFVIEQGSGIGCMLKFQTGAAQAPAGFHNLLDEGGFRRGAGLKAGDMGVAHLVEFEARVSFGDEECFAAAVVAAGILGGAEFSGGRLPSAVIALCCVSR